MNNFETDLMINSDVETEQPINTHLNLSTKHGRQIGSKTTKKTGNIYGRPRKQIRGQSSIMAFTKCPQQLGRKHKQIPNEITVDDPTNNTTDEEERIISPTNYNHEGAATDDITYDTIDGEMDNEIDLDEVSILGMSSNVMPEENALEDISDNEWAIDDERETEELNESKFMTIDNDAASIPEESCVNKYLAEIQERLKGKTPVEYQHGTFWVHKKPHTLCLKQIEKILDLFTLPEYFYGSLTICLKI